MPLPKDGLHICVASFVQVMTIIRQFGGSWITLGSSWDWIQKPWVVDLCGCPLTSISANKLSIRKRLPSLPSLVEYQVISQIQ